MANWFLDSGTIGSGGQYDGSSTNTAWRTIERPLQGSDLWSTVTDTGGPVTGAGDIVWIKDDHTEVWDSADIIRILYSGSNDPNNPVIYRADFAGVQAWGAAGGGARPSVTLVANNNCQFDGAGDTHIRFEGIDFIVPDGVHTGITNFWDIDYSSVEFYNCTISNIYGRFQCPGGGHFHFEDTELDWRRTASAWASGMFLNSAGYVSARRCVFSGAKFGFWSSTNRASVNELEDVEFGEPNVAAGSAIILGSTSGNNWDMRTTCNGIKAHADWANYVLNMSNARRGCHATFMNWDDNPRVYKRYEPHGTITTTETAGDLHAGGADQTTVMEPTSLCNEYMGGLEWKSDVWAPDSQSRTYSVWVKLDDGAGGAWSGYPTAAELIFEVSYLDTASAVSRTVEQSTDVVSSTAWTELAISGITTAEPGLVRWRVILKTNDGGTGERVLIDNRIRVV